MIVMVEITITERARNWLFLSKLSLASPSRLYGFELGSSIIRSISHETGQIAPDESPQINFIAPAQHDTTLKSGSSLDEVKVSDQGLR
jgi:hypothetical protein